jgi:hypothetical protein
MHRLRAVAALAFLLLLGCSDHRVLVRGAVLQPGMKVEARALYGTVSIAYRSPTRRTFAWDGEQKTTAMIPREEEWMGAWGLYQPAGWPYWGVRVVAQESVRNFADLDGLYKYLDEYKAEMGAVYTNDGLVVGFSRNPERDQINVDVWQLEVNGKKPSTLKGADDSRVRLSVSPEVPCPSPRPGFVCNITQFQPQSRGR